MSASSGKHFKSVVVTTKIQIQVLQSSYVRQFVPCNYAYEWNFVSKQTYTLCTYRSSKNGVSKIIKISW